MICKHLRFVAAIVGLSSGLATPATALGHGFEHARASGSTQHAHDGDAHRPDPSESFRGAYAAEFDGSPAPGDDHPHALLEVGLAARVECDLAPIPGPAVNCWFDSNEIVDAAAPTADLAVPIPVPAGPPPPARAPPLS